ncbi:MAG: CYTH domain-containing protein [Bacteroidales bacterium]|nr:CYTH domain-containing protein [Bacteroidales bacterium]
MPKEIERKFLVKSNLYKSLGKRDYLHQGFLSTEKERVVRIRIKGEKAWITIKGISSGATRAEFEYEIPKEDAQYMLENLCIRPTIEKYRYKINIEGFTWEVDEFLGENEGLVVAEIELEAEDQEFPAPEWIGEEVTGDPRYYNANLVSNPFKNWKS